MVDHAGDPAAGPAQQEAPAPRLEAIAVPGLPEVRPGTDLAAEVVRACGAEGVRLGAGDVVVVASKVVAKAEGRCVAAERREQVLTEQTVRVVAQRRLPDGRVTRVVQSRSGPVLAAAGIDASDVPEGTVLLLPADPDASARALRAGLRALTGTAPAVVVSDTAGRPWRHGVTDFALGAAGLTCLDDVRGAQDRFGRPLEVTVRAVADEVAALADLVKGKARGLPVAVVRGLERLVVDDDGPGAGACVRVGPGDWFAHGSVEAVRHALGVDEADPPPLDRDGEPAAGRVRRLVALATAPRSGLGARDVTTDLDVLAVTVEVDEDGAGRVLLCGPPVLCGSAAERVTAALRSEGVDAVADLRAEPVQVSVSAWSG
ncbi:coenzyme F420-0:L-glutamate ligase [Thalassiella azotivora]